MAAGYDIIIAGGGCAGLSLLHRLSQSSLVGKRILVLDTEPKTRNDKTWCFWASSELPFSLPCTPRRAWSKLAFEGRNIRSVEDIAPLQYYYVRSEDFYAGAYATADQMPHVEFRYESVKEIWEVGNSACVRTDASIYEASWVFSSIISPRRIYPQQHIYLHQHFGGWFIRSEHPVFDPEQMTLMDFRVPQNEATAFTYVLPFDAHTALVEFTVFSSESWTRSAYDQALESYLKEHLGIQRYTILEREYGSIPMTNHPLHQQTQGRVIQLGTAGGLTKPTTGYTFRRIQEDVEARVSAWENTGSPVLSRRPRGRYAFYDDLLLYLLLIRPNLGRGIFEKLFARNDIRTILHFLDEGVSLPRDLWIIGRLPWKPFLQAFWQYKVLKKLPQSAYQSTPALYKAVRRSKVEQFKV
ncbi:MAG: lycopene cyclase family protein [Bacteroidota bacterium]